MTYKAVIFDMGGVVIGGNDGDETAKTVSMYVKEMFEMFGKQFYIPIKAMETGQMSIQQIEPILVEFAKKLPSQPDLELFRNWERHAKWNGTRKLMNKFMLGAIEKVRENGLKTALLTNNFWADNEKTISFLPVDPSYFDVIVESCRLGISKPDKRIFDVTLEKLGYDASEVIFLDDLPMYVQGAEMCGIKSIEVQDQEKAAAELLDMLQIV